MGVRESHDESGLLSIGDLSESSGISPDTLRVWERRYGRPRPLRLPSGHRRYTADQVPWLRQVAEALSRGHRAGAVVGLPDAELEALLARDNVLGDHAKEVGLLLRFVEELRAEALLKHLRRERWRLGPRRFLRERVAPLVEAAGRGWAEGTLQVRHEHFLTEIVEDRLRVVRSRLRMPADAPRVVLATLPGEQHGLGLQMAALTCALERVRPRILGTDVPLPEIVQAARQVRARAVLISVSLSSGGVATDRVLRTLRKSLPADVALLVGGAGTRGPRRRPRGVEVLDGLDGLEARLRRL